MIFTLKISFILTMWYVNLSNRICCSFNFSSFILTMWYVNKGSNSWGYGFTISFILTMWYVNNGLCSTIPVIPMVLY